MTLINFKKQYKQRGYSLVEVLVAITILLLSIAGPMTIANKGLKSSAFARDQLTAFMLAQEGIEVVVAVRNENVISEINSGSPDMTALWSWFDSPSGSFADCIVTNLTQRGCNINFTDNGVGVVNNAVACGNLGECDVEYDSSASRLPFDFNNTGPSVFNREIKVMDADTVNPGKEVYVESVVTWQSPIFGSSQQTVKLTTSLFNIYGQ